MRSKHAAVSLREVEPVRTEAQNESLRSFSLFDKGIVISQRVPGFPQGLMSDLDRIPLSRFLVPFDHHAHLVDDRVRMGNRTRRSLLMRTPHETGKQHIEEMHPSPCQPSPEPCKRPQDPLGNPHRYHGDWHRSCQSVSRSQLPVSRHGCRGVLGSFADGASEWPVGQRRRPHTPAGLAPTVADATLRWHPEAGVQSQPLRAVGRGYCHTPSHLYTPQIQH